MNLLALFWSPIIASISLLIFLYTLYKNRTHLEVQWNQDIEEANLDSIFLLKNGEEVPLNYAYFTHVDIINPSPRDIGFFSLRAFNPNTNQNLYLLTQKSIDLGLDGSLAIRRDPSGRESRLDIPESNSGILKANSITKLDLIIVLTGVPNDVNNLSNLDTIAVSFRIAKYILTNRDPFSRGIFRHYWYKGIKYDISGWQKRRLAQQQAQLSELERESKVPKQFQSLQKAVKSLIDLHQN